MSNIKIQTLSAADNLEQLKQWASSYPEKQNLLTAGTGISIDGSVISCTLDNTVFKVVESLPTRDIDRNVIYVVPSEQTGEQNTYTEYIYVNGAWEKLGEFKAGVDLSDYYTKEETYSSTEIDELLRVATSGGLTSVNASGTTPLTLSASISGTTATITGSVADATANTAGVVKPYSVLTSTPSVNSVTTTNGRYYGVSTNRNNALVVNVPWTDTTSSLSDLGGVGTVNASGVSPLTLSASKSGTTVTITGSVDAYTKEQSDAILGDYYTKKETYTQEEVDALLEGYVPLDMYNAKIAEYDAKFEEQEQTNSDLQLQLDYIVQIFQNIGPDKD